jgi:hypothetical protein
MNRSESIAKIASALVKAQAEMGNAVKDSKNPFFKSKYADLNAVREACMPALNKHGVSVIQPTSVIEGKLYVETVLLHESGEFLSGLYEVVVGKQNDPQALGASISYSRRYGLQSMVNIGAADDDGESAVDRGNTKSYNNITVTTTPAVAATVVVTNNKPAEAAPAASRGSFRKNPAKSESSVPSGDL